MTERKRGTAETVVRARGLLPSLSPAEQRVARVIIEEAATASRLTITDLAERAGSSETTVIRFCRAMGFAGYSELRLTLAAESGRRDDTTEAIGSDISPGDDLAEVVKKIAFADARAVEETASQIDIAVLGQVVELLAEARRVDIYGVGASAFVATDFQHKLHRIGRVAFAWSDTHVAMSSAALLDERDVAFGISHTGTTSDTIDAFTEAKRHGARTVALTNFPRSPITTLADLVLTTAARETTYRSGAMSSRLAQLTVIDCVFVGVAQRTYQQTRTALDATYAAVRDRRISTDRRRT
ncbi:MurR/RpiR family transcriptional regulator [Actinoplanes derwentensis]|uniref:DNA-binding transcriptional regulator, MurR/RpiR family, contains HTH and SIS domains n=1 Tax=Actinoplanes derwentensis TaxID=113562 RepID=A0A1H1YRX4_9ACTN|nr:MurR/RpiR family transcriptional regulator [Actinoplanes derwentensis]GID81262.1 RpiR family transcriptional regulator [Actinoplanes derwentensis]SDT24133.1 DNA-binding transcriptional regulator, MurR/RpiR family, contains HTH and SIS domains [Actinoplanes derwentensis]